MTDDASRDDEARRLIESVFGSEFEMARDSYGELASVLSGLSVLAGWDLDGPTAVRTLALHVVMANLADEETTEGIPGFLQALEGTSFFRVLEDAWRRGRETAEGA